MTHIFTVDEVPGLSVGASGRVYSSKSTTQDRAVICEEEHNITLTVVWGFNMLGMPTRPLLIESDRATTRTATTRSLSLPEGFVKQHPEVLWHKTKSGFITTPIFMSWARHLRRLVGDDKPIFLLSDGHATRTNLDTVDLLLRLNIQLFLIPSNTSHALAASDQFHQHLHKKRFILERGTRHKNNAALIVLEKKECLLKAMSFCAKETHLMRAAFEHAGITEQSRDVQWLRNKPAPDMPEPESVCLTPQESPDANSAIVTPTSSQVSLASPRTLREVARRYKAVTRCNAAADRQIALVQARPSALAAARRKLGQSTQRFTFIGLLDETDVYRELHERKKRKNLKVSKEKRSAAEKLLGTIVRRALGTDDDSHKAPKVAELKSYLDLKEPGAYERNDTRATLIELATIHAGLDPPDSAAADYGTDDSEAESNDTDDDVVYVDFFREQGSTVPFLQPRRNKAANHEHGEVAAADAVPTTATLATVGFEQLDGIGQTTANPALTPPTADMELIQQELKLRTDLVDKFWTYHYDLATADERKGPK